MTLYFARKSEKNVDISETSRNWRKIPLKLNQREKWMTRISPEILRRQPQEWKCLPLRFYVKSIFDTSSVLKIANLTVLQVLKSDFLHNLQFQKLPLWQFQGTANCNNSYFRALETVKWCFLSEFWIHTWNYCKNSLKIKWFHVKSEGGNVLKCLQSEFLAWKKLMIFSKKRFQSEVSEKYVKKCLGFQCMIIDLRLSHSVENSVNLLSPFFGQKFRETNWVSSKFKLWELSRSRDIFQTRVNFSFFHTVHQWLKSLRSQNWKTF